MSNLTEEQKFETAFRKAQRQIRALAESTCSEYSSPENDKLVRALDKLCGRVRFVVSEVLAADWTQAGFEALASHYYDRLAGLIAARRFAARSAGHNYRESLHAESVRLARVIRENRATSDGAFRLGYR